MLDLRRPDLMRRENAPRCRVRATSTVNCGLHPETLGLSPDTPDLVIQRFRMEVRLFWVLLELLGIMLCQLLVFIRGHG